MINITDSVCFYQRVGKWQKQKVIFSVPVNQIIVEEMLKKTSHPELWEDDVLNTPLSGTAWRKCTSSNHSKQMRPKLSHTNFFQGYLATSVAQTNEPHEQVCWLSFSRWKEEEILYATAAKDARNFYSSN